MFYRSTPKAVWGFLVCVCVADLKDGDVPAETLQRSSYLATFQPLLRRQSLQLLMKLHGQSPKQTHNIRLEGGDLYFSSKEFEGQSVNKKLANLCERS